MRTIWKFPFHVSDSVAIEMPRDAVILSAVAAAAAPDAEMLVVWAEVETEAPTETRALRVIGTGHPLPELRPDTLMRHIGTTISASGFVWHVYEPL